MKLLMALFFYCSVFADSYIDTLHKDLARLQKELIDKQNLIDASKIKFEHLKTFENQAKELHKNTQKASMDIIAQLYVLLQMPPILVMISKNGSFEHLLALSVLRANFENLQKQQFPLQISASQVQEGVIGAQQEITALGMEIKNLQDNAAQVEETIKKEILATKSVDNMIMLSLEKAVLKRPVSGKIMASDDKSYVKGMRLEAGSGEIVKCPIDGKIVFSGKFQSFGDLLIIEVSARVRVVLAGLGNVSVVLDQQVRAGEKLGNMPKQNLPSFLYLEIRQDGQAMHPQITFLD